MLLVSSQALSDEMVTYARKNCGARVYTHNGKQLQRADAYGGDAAHYVARSITAGGCLPGIDLSKDLWAYNRFVSPKTGKHYNLLCIGGGKSYRYAHLVSLSRFD